MARIGRSHPSTPQTTAPRAGTGDFTATDSGTLTESFSITAADSAADSVTLAEAQTIGQADTDSAALTESASLAQAPTDAAALTESASVDQTATDSGTLGESASLSTSNIIYTVAIDWNNDGDFAGAGEELTTRVLGRQDLTIRYGRDQTRSLSPAASGEADLEIDNQSRDYSPDYTASPLYGNILPARPIRIQGTHLAVTYTLFRGHIDEYTVKPALTELSTVQIGALDPMAKLKDTKVSTQLHKGLRTGEAIGKVLDAIDWPPGDRDIDSGATTIRWWWEEGADAFEALQKIVNSEGPGAIIHADENGKIVFRDRHHRLLRTAGNTAQVSFTGDAEPKFSTPLGYDHGWRDIINHATIKVEELDPSPQPETVWESADVRSIGAGEDITVRIDLDDPVIEPELDFDLVSGTVSFSLVQQSGQAIDISITGIGASVISNIVVTARPVTARRSYQIQQEAESSITKYGQRAYTHEAPWAGVHDAKAIADLLIGQRAERLPIVTMRLVSGTVTSSTRLLQQLNRDLSDRVHVRESETGLDHDFFVETIQHHISEAGLVLETEFGLERAAAHPTNVFTFDQAGKGFDDGVFGQPGLDDPVTLFRFDVSGSGFDQGVFAT